MARTADDAEVDDLLQLFAQTLSSSSTSVELDLTQSVVVVTHGDVEQKLYLPRSVMAENLGLLEEERDNPFGGELPPVEVYARLLGIHLEESLATRQADESGWWSYGNGGFEPQPPWDAHRERGTRR